MIARGDVMGYRIIYGDDENKVKWGRVMTLSCLFLGLFLGWTFRNWPEGWDTVCTAVFPEGSEKAFSLLEECVSRGQGTVESVFSFCRSLFLETGETVY